MKKLQEYSCGGKLFENILCGVRFFHDCPSRGATLSMCTRLKFDDLDIS